MDFEKEAAYLQATKELEPLLSHLLAQTSDRMRVDDHDAGVICIVYDAEGTETHKWRFGDLGFFNATCQSCWNATCQAFHLLHENPARVVVLGEHKGRPFGGLNIKGGWKIVLGGLPAEWSEAYCWWIAQKLAIGNEAYRQTYISEDAQACLGILCSIVSAEPRLIKNATAVASP